MLISRKHGRVLYDDIVRMSRGVILDLCAELTGRRPHASTLTQARAILMRIVAREWDFPSVPEMPEKFSSQYVMLMQYARAGTYGLYDNQLRRSRGMQRRLRIDLSAMGWHFVRRNRKPGKGGTRRALLEWYILYPPKGKRL